MEDYNMHNCNLMQVSLWNLLACWLTVSDTAANGRTRLVDGV